MYVLLDLVNWPIYVGVTGPTAKARKRRAYQHQYNGRRFKRMKLILLTPFPTRWEANLQNFLVTAGFKLENDTPTRLGLQGSSYPGDPFHDDSLVSQALRNLDYQVCKPRLMRWVDRVSKGSN